MSRAEPRSSGLGHRGRGLQQTLRIGLLAAAMVLGAVGDCDVTAEDGELALNVYFNKEGLGEADAACSEVAPLIRTVPKTQSVARTALQQLFRGPTPAEQAQGYHSWFSERTRDILKDVRIVDGTAYVDLHDIRQLIPGATSSCGSVQFLSQIEATLKQFPTIERVVLAIKGQPRLFYEWMELECNETIDFCDDRHF
jgi:spore germination protein GerM